MSNATVRDVAARAGVSLTTVHRVLRDNGYASEDVRRRVRAAAEALNYRPNAIAQSLRRRRSGLIGHIVPSLYPNLFVACVATGVEERARALGLATVTCNTHGSAQDEWDYVELLLRQRAEGIVFTTPVSEDNVLRAQESGVPVCVVERPKRLDGVDVILADSRAGAREAVGYLLTLGHRDIAFIGQASEEASDLNRFSGYCEAFEERGVARREEWVRLPGYQRADGYSATLELLALPERPTAAFFAGDLAALGAIQALGERHLRAPDDLSIVSMDDTRADTACPPLTSVSMPMWEMGAAAVDLLRRRATAETSSPAETLVFPMRLTVRASCRPLPVSAPA